MPFQKNLVITYHQDKIYIYIFFFFFFVFSPSLLMHGCLGNIQWRVGLQPGLLLASNSSSLECFMYIYIYIYLSLSPLIILSLSSIHISKFSSSLFLPLTNVSIEPGPKRARSRVNGRSRAGVLVCLFRFQISSRVSILMRWRNWLAAGLDLASFRKNVVRSPPRPRCLGRYYLFG